MNKKRYWADMVPKKKRKRLHAMKVYYHSIAKPREAVRKRMESKEVKGLERLPQVR